MQYHLPMEQTRNKDNQFALLLKANNERVTSPRLIIFRQLLRGSPIPMAKLRVKSALDGVDTATVYRTIALFTRLGLVQEIGVGSRRLLELTDNFGSHHHHFWCTKCGKIVNFDDNHLEATLDALASRLDISIESHQLEISGICNACQ
jgi:Fur family ferric uptake transcriptional regulator